MIFENYFPISGGCGCSRRRENRIQGMSFVCALAFADLHIKGISIDWVFLWFWGPKNKNVLYLFRLPRRGHPSAVPFSAFHREAATFGNLFGAQLRTSGRLFEGKIIISLFWTIGTTTRAAERPPSRIGQQLGTTTTGAKRPPFWRQNNGSLLDNWDNN